MIVRTIEQPAGDGATRTTLTAMRQLIRAGSVNPVVRSLAVGLVRGLGERDQPGQLDVLRWFLASHTTFIPDPYGVELVHDPAILARSIRQNGVVAADCDDIAVLAGALARSIGFKVRLVAVALSSKVFQHVWAEAQDRAGRWHDFDVTRPAQGLPSGPARRVLTLRV